MQKSVPGRNRNLHNGARHLPVNRLRKNAFFDSRSRAARPRRPSLADPRQCDHRPLMRPVDRDQDAHYIVPEFAA